MKKVRRNWEENHEETLRQRKNKPLPEVVAMDRLVKSAQITPVKYYRIKKNIHTLG